LLLTGLPPSPDADELLRSLAAAQQPGSELRSVAGTLPRMWLLDDDRVGTRVGITAGSAYGMQRVWSRDEAHVRAVRELFELWWQGARPGPVTPRRPEQPEPELDVDEWDPDELPEGLS
jgi:hypothetical protein